ncbi:Ketopantoate reductase PanE/ApbA family protein [Tritrichomonas foetus]|uniref:Ketopantoate reductase PanE/ApbA family protein n=1 Tax=Tritrichomonas foetus TaxID=1144522 RepID=A0A1J4K6R8_9EUKA|nr:Ketopantoate reductase PanE/ApbA family protein [Tritrichomonas foetus]|eukprot:OHT06666.1 Ketopantoate reductase PanE/ApbA family protein [Tritrichomonas foetus]
MRVYILGAGAMGTMYGTTLIKGGHDVIFLDSWQPLLDNMKSNPIAERRTDDGNVEEVPVKVIPMAEAPNEPGDFIIVTVKSSMTQGVMDIIKPRGIIGPNTLIMTFQGGFENPEIIANHMDVKGNCLPAFTSSYCKAVGMMSIENFGIKRSTLWPMGLPTDQKPPQNVVSAVDELNKAGCHFDLTPEAITDRWKLLVYYPTNIAVSSIVGLNFGDCWNTPECQELLIYLAKECALIAKLDGVDENYFNEEIAVKTVKDIAVDGSPTHAGSMLQDVRNKRITEIDGTNGALLRRAAVHKIDLPYTRAVFAIVRTIEQNYNNGV